MSGPNAETNYLLDEYRFLRSYGIPTRECARRLHRSDDGLRRMLKQAALRGDPRSDWTPHVDEFSGSYQSIQNRRERARGWVA